MLHISNENYIDYMDEKNLDTMTHLAKNDNYKAQEWLGLFYSTDIFGHDKVDLKKAEYWFLKAANGKSQTAIDFLCNYYIDLKRFDNALYYANKLIESGYNKKDANKVIGKIYYEFGVAHENGKISSKNLEKSIFYYIKSLYLGYNKSKRKINKYSETHSEFINYFSYKEECISIYNDYNNDNYSLFCGDDYIDKFTKAAKFLADYFYTGNKYERELGFTERNINFAFEIYKKLVSVGDREALYKLGLLYENGDMGAPDLDEALKWYIKASEAGVGQAVEKMNYLKSIIEQ